MTRDQPAAPPPAAPEPTGTWTLSTAAGLAAAEALVLMAVALGRSVAPVTNFWLALKLVFCFRVVRLRPGAFLALLLYEGGTVLFALAGTGAALAVRLPLAASAVAVLVLLGRSAHLFPSPTLPRP